MPKRPVSPSDIKPDLDDDLLSLTSSAPQVSKSVIKGKKQKTKDEKDVNTGKQKGGSKTVSRLTLNPIYSTCNSLNSFLSLRVGTDDKTWSADEDAVLVAMMQDLIQKNIWFMAKTDERLASRGSYGVQYHAKVTFHLIF